ncbi:MAG: addiction module antidote protein [Pseudomonas sp.]
MTVRLTRWDITDHLQTDEDRALFLEACIDEAGDDSAFMVQALCAIARAKGVDDLAAIAGVDPASLSDDCELSFDTFLKAIRALGLQLHAEVVPTHAGQG